MTLFRLFAPALGILAAAAALAGIVCLMVPRNDGNGTPPARPAATTTQPARPLAPQAASRQASPLAHAAASPAATTPQGTMPAFDMRHDTTAATTRAADTLSARDSSHPHSSTGTPRTPVSLPAHEETHRRPNAPTAPATSNGERERRLAVSVYMNGSSGNTLSHRYLSINQTTALGPGNSGWNDNPRLGIIAYNQGKEVEKKVHHHLQLKTGVSLAWQLSPRVSLTTGLTYAYLKSDFRDGGNSHYQKEQQQLQQGKTIPIQPPPRHKDIFQKNNTPPYTTIHATAPPVARPRKDISPHAARPATSAARYVPSAPRSAPSTLFRA